MVLLYHGRMDDPRIGQLDAAAYWVWIAAVSMCNASGADTIRVAELHGRVTEAREAKPEERPNVDECIAAFVRADLARRLPDDRVQMLARLDLWAFESDDDPDVVVGPGADD